MSDNSENHHYVPKLYLRNFTFNSGKSLVYAMSKNGCISSRHKSIRRICYEENYNTPQQERYLSQIEREYANVLKKFIEVPNHRDTTLLPTRDFIEFVCLLIGNNIHVRQRLSDMLSEIDLKIAGLRFDHNISIKGDHKRRLDLSFAFSDAIFEEFHSWQFVRREFSAGHKVFITSDDPVSILNPENLSYPVQTKLKWKDPQIKTLDDESIPIAEDRVSRRMQAKLTLDSISFGKDVVMIFPITPSSCLIGFSDSDRHAKFIGRPIRDINTMGFINLITFTHCNKAVYSHSKELLEVSKSDKHNFMDYCERRRRIPTFDFGIG